MIYCVSCGGFLETAGELHPYEEHNGNMVHTYIMVCKNEKCPAYLLLQMGKEEK